MMEKLLDKMEKQEEKQTKRNELMKKEINEIKKKENKQKKENEQKKINKQEKKVQKKVKETKDKVSFSKSVALSKIARVSSDISNKINKSINLARSVKNFKDLSKDLKELKELIIMVHHQGKTTREIDEAIRDINNVFGKDQKKYYKVVVKDVSNILERVGEIIDKINKSDKEKPIEVEPEVVKKLTESVIKSLPDPIKQSELTRGFATPIRRRVYTIDKYNEFERYHDMKRWVNKMDKMNRLYDDKYSEMFNVARMNEIEEREGLPSMNYYRFKEYNPRFFTRVGVDGREGLADLREI